MISRVILTTDFSDNSRKAADFVFTNFDNLKVIYYHAYGTPQVGQHVFISIDDILEKDAKSEMAIEQKRIAEKFPNTNCVIDVVLINGDFGLGLKDVIKNRQAQMVVMGTKGAGAIEGKIFGSTASQLIGKCALPLLLIPDEYALDRQHKTDKIALASDLRKLTDLAFIQQFVSEINPAEKTTLDVLYVSRNAEKIDENDKAALLESLHALKPEFHVIVDDSISKGIEEFVDLHNHDLLILIHRHHSFFERLFKSSISKNIALSVHVPMLVLQE